MEENLPYGWKHTHEMQATNKYGEMYDIDQLCDYLGRHRKGTQDWEWCRDSGINYEKGLGDGIVRQNRWLPSGRWLFPRWVREVGFPAPPPPPMYQGPVHTQAQINKVHGGEVKYAAVPKDAPLSWRPALMSCPPPPPPPPVSQYAGQNVFAASNGANSLPPSAPVAAAPQHWEFPADSLPASYEASSFRPTRARTVPQYSDPTNDCAMTFHHAEVVNPWAALAKRLPSPAPASIEAKVMPPALPEQNWHPEDPFPVSHRVPFFSPSPAPASAPAEVDIDVPMRIGTLASSQRC